jgi:hypothetical protein
VKQCFLVALVLVAAGCGKQASPGAPCGATGWDFSAGVATVIEIAAEVTVRGDVEPRGCEPTKAQALADVDEAIARLRAREPSPGYSDWAIASYLLPERQRLGGAY